MSAVIEVPEISESSCDEATRTQIRGSGLLVAGYVLELAIGFLPHLLLVRYLTTQGYGAWAYAVSLITAFQTFTLCLNDGLQRFVPIYHERQEYGKLLGTIIVASTATLLIGSGFIALVYLIPHTVFRLINDQETSRLLLILVLLVPIESLEIMLMRLFACFNRARLIFVLQHAIAPGARLILVLLMIGYHKDLKFLALGRLYIAIPTTVLYLWLLARVIGEEGLLQELRHRIQLPFREMLVFSSPMVLATALSTIENAVIVLLLARFHGTTSVAFYRVVLPLATLNNLVMNAFSWLYIPSASRLLAKHDYSGINHLYWRTAGWISVLTFPLFAITFCFSGPLTTFLYGQRYAESGLVLLLLSVGYYSNVALGFNGVTLKVLGKIRYVLLSNLASAVIKLGFSALLIPAFGARGAAAAVALGLISYNLFMQSGLRLTAGIQIFAKDYAPFSILIAMSTAALFLLRGVVGQNIYLALLVTGAATSMVLLAAKNYLSIATTFPEARRLPVLGRLLA